MNVLIDGIEYVPVPELLPDGYLSEHFKRTEFACNHCGKLPKDPPESLLKVLEDVRAHFGAPVVINSGWRCETHNANCGGAKGSKHLEGIAADIAVQGVHAHTVHAYLEDVLNGTGGLGKYDTFTHVDVRGTPARW